MYLTYLFRFWPISVLSIFCSVNPRGNPKKIKKEQEMDLKETIAVDCIKQEVNDVPEVESEYSNHSEKDEKIHFEMLPIEKCENQVSPWQTGLSVEENNKYKSDYEDIRSNTLSHSDCPNPHVVDSNAKVPKDSSLSCGKPNSERSTTSECVESSQYLECISASSDKEDFQQLLKPQTPNSPFQCEICSKSFSLKCYLSRHMIIHTFERPFQCEICSKSFTQKSTLNTHMITHSSERPFQCEICSKYFTQKKTLNTHMVNHSSIRPFQCEICSKSFTQKSTFNSHMIIHTSKRPFQCEICSKSFIKKSHLNRHMSTHTSKHPFQ